MSYKELEKLSHQDFRLFEKRLTAFFKTNWDESFVQLRKHLENRFSRWRLSNIDQMIDDSITRLVRKLVEFDQRGEEISNLKAFASTIAWMVAHEHQKDDFRTVDIEPHPLNETNRSRGWEFRYSVDGEIHAIRKEIEMDCMTACLEKLPTERKALLYAYYPIEPMKPEEKQKLRERLALGQSGDQATVSQPTENQIGALRVKVSKEKTKLQKCLADCAEGKRSRNTRLVYLEGQQVRK